MAGNPAAPDAARPLGFVCFVSVEVAPRRPGANDDRLRLFIVLLAHAFPMKALAAVTASPPAARTRWSCDIREHGRIAFNAVARDLGIGRVEFDQDGVAAMSVSHKAGSASAPEGI